ncbi:MAG: hypothetical protein P8N31_12540 [Planctomycetota bacterium]|nr:hypothetical protein [Planctomycetota bacterium]
MQDAHKATAVGHGSVATAVEPYEEDILVCNEFDDRSLFGKWEL